MVEIKDLKCLELRVLEFVKGAEEEEESLSDKGNVVLKEKELRGC